MDTEPLVTHKEVAAALFAVHDILEELREIKCCLEARMAGKRKGRKTKAEREAWDAHVDDTLRRLREAAESILARGEKREAAEGR
jgi:hypothetical protein